MTQSLTHAAGLLHGQRQIRVLTLLQLQTYTDPKTNATTVLAYACNPSFMMCYNTAATGGRRLLQDSTDCGVFNAPSTTPTLNTSEHENTVCCHLPCVA